MLYNPHENKDTKIPNTSLRMESCADSSLAAEDPYLEDTETVWGSLRVRGAETYLLIRRWKRFTLAGRENPPFVSQVVNLCHLGVSFADPNTTNHHVYLSVEGKDEV